MVNCSTPIISGKSDIKGIITVSGLSEGVYYFREKITGIHNMDLTPFLFVVPDNGTKVVMKIYTPSGGSSGEAPVAVREICRVD